MANFEAFLRRHLKNERKPLFSEEWVTFVVQKNLSKKKNQVLLF